ncbi:helix-turn-helix domain-containing protein [Streptomyces yaizuensis]|uniref:Scr1 family TA system antitoxin-like transcriptional regulator n=1 Tax=Streptomyces yaizuensis TaxID=2989713 RepID=A0AA86JGE8_9ACTN|nr:helix-turn-helix transcriptional regulator [Streptomyces sp. YSPA8]BDT39544.1 Scr1 family TA system antitoxin-like transcriptional regulator [Streptomyces sp. YSPA8]
MAANTGATFLRIMLGAELTRLRDGAGLSGEQAAKAAGCAPSTITNIEKGTTGFRRIGQLTDLLTAYGVGFEGQELLLDWYKNAKGDDWWTPNTSVLPSGMPAYLGFESGARIVSPWCPSVVYGLLQTEEYARALIESAKAADERTTDFVDSSVEVRANRKRLITEHGVELVCLMDESALRNVVGDGGIMRRQYAEIAELSKLRNVTVRIIPFSAPAYRVTSGGFTVLDFDRKALPGPVVAVSTVSHTMQVVSKPKVVKQFARRFDFLARGALPDHETPALLEKYAREV